MGRGLHHAGPIVELCASRCRTAWRWSITMPNPGKYVVVVNGTSQTHGQQQVEAINVASNLEASPGAAAAGATLTSS